MENILVDLISLPINNSSGIVIAQNTCKNSKEKKLFFHFEILKNLIFLFEDLIKTLQNSSYILQNPKLENDDFNITCNDLISTCNKKINLYGLYNFYYIIQMRLLKTFNINFDEEKNSLSQKKFFPDKFQKEFLKEEKHQIKNKILDDFLYLIKSENENSLIFQNWIIFFFKNGNIFDAYKIVRSILTTNKRPPFIYLLFNLNFEITKFYPNLWK